MLATIRGVGIVLILGYAVVFSPIVHGQRTLVDGPRYVVEIDRERTFN